jgi:hypothetical protein
MWCQSPHELATGLGIVYVKHDVRAKVRLGPVAQYRRLNLVELHAEGGARKLASEAPRRSTSCMAFSPYGKPT